MNVAVTGSVTMKTVAKAQLPTTMCHQNGMANAALVSDPMRLKTDAMAIVPSVTPAMVRHEPTPVAMITSAPIRQASAEVSPRLPGMNPMNASHQEYICCSMPTPLFTCASMVGAAVPSTVAEVGAAVHTASPDICAG